MIIINMVVSMLASHLTAKEIWAMSWENRIFAKTEVQISCAVTAKLISPFQGLWFRCTGSTALPLLLPKFQASSFLLWVYKPICIWPGRKPRRPVFSQWGSYMMGPPLKASSEKLEKPGTPFFKRLVHHWARKILTLGSLPKGDFLLRRAEQRAKFWPPV